MTRAKIPSSGFGVSGILPAAPASSRSRTLRGARPSRPKRRTTASACAYVLGSGAVGPEAITSTAFPITSESAKVRTVAGAAARASCPPFRSERCLRTVLSSPIVAPAASRRAVSRRFSSSVIGGAGAGRSAEPPPEIAQITRSSGRADSASPRSSTAAARPRSSGTG